MTIRQRLEGIGDYFSNIYVLVKESSIRTALLYATIAPRVPILRMYKAVGAPVMVKDTHEVDPTISGRDLGMLVTNQLSELHSSNKVDSKPIGAPIPPSHVMYE